MPWQLGEGIKSVGSLGTLKDAGKCLQRQPRPLWLPECSAQHPWGAGSTTTTLWLKGVNGLGQAFLLRDPCWGFPAGTSQGVNGSQEAGSYLCQA